MSNWRVAKSLLTLRIQVNTKFPNRNKDSDGTIGDDNHQNRSSDHNPWVGPGIVTAVDITHDPAHGVDSYRMAEELRQSRDKRIKYIISNRRICSNSVAPWTWRPYNGSNPHDKHVHLSVNVQAQYYDDGREWQLPMLDVKKKVNSFDEAAILSGLDRALNEKVRELNMGKLSSVAARIAEAKKHLESEADALVKKLDGLNAKAPAAFDNAHGILDQHHADLDSMDSELRQLSNLPPH